MVRGRKVSILVFLELALRPHFLVARGWWKEVSILVFLELALRRLRALRHDQIFCSFNPCFPGTRSSTLFDRRALLPESVSILVFLELALRHVRAHRRPRRADDVSILVFLELALRHYSKARFKTD